MRRLKRTYFNSSIFQCNSQWMFTLHFGSTSDRHEFFPFDINTLVIEDVGSNNIRTSDRQCTRLVEYHCIDLLKKKDTIKIIKEVRMIDTSMSLTEYTRDQRNSRLKLFAIIKIEREYKKLLWLFSHLKSA